MTLDCFRNGVKKPCSQGSFRFYEAGGSRAPIVCQGALSVLFAFFRLAGHKARPHQNKAENPSKNITDRCCAVLPEIVLRRSTNGNLPVKTDRCPASVSLCVSFCFLGSRRYGTVSPRRCGSLRCSPPLQGRLSSLPLAGCDRSCGRSDPCGQTPDASAPRTRV